MTEPEQPPKRRATAESMASRQREISVSEFFTKNRHLLGFDNPAKALLTTVKEAVDNSLDACEEAGILPDIKVEITEVAPGASANQPGKFRVAVEDNGPGIVKPQIPKIFAKLLYGSKFHRLKQSRGQQGIGISAAGLYGQLTTGKPVVIISKTGKGRPAFLIHLRIDTKRNQPDVVKDDTTEWDKDHGTRVEIELVAAYRGGRTGVQEYLEQTAVANPHLALTFVPPKPQDGKDRFEFPRVSHELPREAQEIKPHPHGVELGMLQMMMQDSGTKTVKQVLVDDFSRVSPAVAQQVCEVAKVSSRLLAEKLHGEDLERLHKALGQVKVLAPPATAVVPIGEALLIEGLKRRFPKAEFYASTTRPPKVYRGNPFVVEAALAYGGDLAADEPAEIMRLANRVPLQYQPKACAISESVYQTNWRNYEMQQPKGSLPVAPLAIVVHLASVWVPFTSEAKEAVAHYDELLEEMTLSLKECGRKLASHVRAHKHAQREQMRRSLFEKYIPEVAQALAEILGVPKEKTEQPFYKALPAFVDFREDEPPAAKEPKNGKPPPSEPPPAAEGGEAPPAPATPKVKPSGKGRGKAVAVKNAAAEEGGASPGQAPRKGGKGGGAKGRRKGDQLSLVE